MIGYIMKLAKDIDQFAYEYDTYAGQSCEAGDMIFCVSDYSSSYKAADFSVVQNNIVTITNAEIDTIVAS